MSKDVILETEDKSKRLLPARTNDPKVIANILKSKPVKIDGFCRTCDSTIRDDWVATAKSNSELRNLVDFGALRVQEYEILVNALESGELDDHWSEPIFKKLQRYIKNLIQITIMRIKS